MTKRTKELSQRYSDAWTETKRAVDVADPEGLLGMGAPPDEYDDAVAHLVIQVLKGEEFTAKELQAWFVRRYGAEASVITLVDELKAIQRRLLDDG